MIWQGCRVCFPLGQFCDHMFKPLPQMWHERLGQTKPVFTLNAYSMLEPHMPCVGRNDFTRQMAQLVIIKLRCEKEAGLWPEVCRFDPWTSWTNLGERRQRAVLVPSPLPLLRSYWARNLPPIALLASRCWSAGAGRSWKKAFTLSESTLFKERLNKQRTNFHPGPNPHLCHLVPFQIIITVLTVLVLVILSISMQ